MLLLLIFGRIFISFSACIFFTFQLKHKLLTLLTKKEIAGMTEEAKAKILKLDETNNGSYAYLRETGNTWQYDPEEVHPKLKARLYRRFESFDKGNDGMMTIEKVRVWADRMKELCDSTDEEIETVRRSLKIFF